MSELGYLCAAFAVTWGGIMIYMIALRRSVQRLADEVATLPAEGEPRAAGAGD